MRSSRACHATSRGTQTKVFVVCGQSQRACGPGKHRGDSEARYPLCVLFGLQKGAEELSLMNITLRDEINVLLWAVRTQDTCPRESVHRFAYARVEVA